MPSSQLLSVIEVIFKSVETFVEDFYFLVVYRVQVCRGREKRGFFVVVANTYMYIIHMFILHVSYAHIDISCDLI